jgi:hypothetical protein
MSRHSKKGRRHNLALPRHGESLVAIRGKVCGQDWSGRQEELTKVLGDAISATQDLIGRATMLYTKGETRRTQLHNATMPRQSEDTYGVHDASH